MLVYQGVASVNPVLLKNAPYDSLRGFLELARASPGRLNYASAGNATSSHLTMELFKRQAGVELVHVPYKGEAPALADVVGGTVSALFATPTVALSMIQSGKVRALAISTRERSPLLPTLPTIAESGLPDFEVGGWYGVLAPAGTPAPVLDRLNRELLAILREPDVRARLAAQGVEPKGSSPEAAGRWIRDETEKWRRLIADAKIVAD